MLRLRPAAAVNASANSPACIDFRLGKFSPHKNNLAANEARAELNLKFGFE
ncbi:MAG: hypothetical protein IJ576_07795 [Synergistaceae bacterium]|nr:hypothetical protein [Synergistaceae bacterium]